MVTPRFCKTAVLCLAMFVALLLASSAFAERIYVAPAGDGVISVWQNHYGESGTSVSSSDSVLSCYQSPYGDYNYLKSDIRIEIPLGSLAGTNLNGATITFNYYSLNSGRGMLEFVHCQEDGIITADEASGFPGGFWDDRAGGTLGWDTYDAAGYVRNQLADGYSYAVFRFTPMTYDTDWRIAAAEDSLGRGAYLEITPVPEPSSVLALFAGISGLGGMLIRRRK